MVGWQKQKDGASAQEFLEKAILGFSHQTTEVFGAGRTDAGVHAKAMAANAYMDTERTPDEVRD